MAVTNKIGISSFAYCFACGSRPFTIILESWMEPGKTLEETLRIEDEWAGTGVSYLKTIV